MNKLLKLKDVHIFSIRGLNFLYQVDSLEICRINTLARDIVDICIKTNVRESVISQLVSKYELSAIEKALDDLQEAGIFLKEGESQYKPFKPMQFEIESPVIGQIVLATVQDCNLACKYCLANHGIFFDQPARMSFDVAKASVEFLIRESKGKDSIRIIFLGGEPFLNFPLIEKTVIYAKEQANKFGKHVKFVTSTNGTVLNDNIIDFLINHDFTVSISIDGPPQIHDENRVYKSGAASYHRILPRVKKYLSRASNKIVAATTLTPSHLDFISILEHLYDIGFKQIRFVPAMPSAACESQEHIFYGESIAQFKTAYTRLLEHEIDYFLDKKEIRLLNLFDLLRNFHLKWTTPFACGMGRFFVGIASNGDIYPCNLFTGLNEYRMGTVFKEFDQGKQLKYVQNMLEVRKRCSQCWIRYSCQGGCLAFNVLSGHKTDILEEHCRNRLEMFEVGIWAYNKVKELDTTSLMDQMFQAFIKKITHR
jgi:uncharacterized protein